MTGRHSIRAILALLLLVVPASAFAPVVQVRTPTTNRLPLSKHQKLPAWALYFTKDVCTVQILMSDTGGGHRASANALRDAFDVLFPGQIACDIVDLYTDYGNMWPYTDYPAMYKLMAKYSFLWDWFYHFGATEFGMQLNAFLQELICFDSFQQCLDRPSCGTDRRADLVVSVHPLCQDVPLRALAALDTKGDSRDPKTRTTPFVTVVTDLGGAHPTWFHSGVDKCFVPSDALNQCARDRNLSPDQIVQYGLPIRSGFWAADNTNNDAYESNNNNNNNNQQPPKKRKKNILARLRRKAGEETSNGDDPQEQATESQKRSTKAAMRTKLDMDPELPAVLVVGGGDGMGGIVNIAKQLGEKLGSSSVSLPEYQMIVVCGSNQEAKEEISAMSFGNGVKVNVQGFVNNMDEWMKASDALVTKAGPGTIAEASICGLPCMLFAYLPGQEEGNVPFVENAGFGKYSGDPAVIADTVTSWLASDEVLEAMQKAALKAARPRATLDIAKDIGEMVLAAHEKNRKSEKELVAVRAR